MKAISVLLLKFFIAIFVLHFACCSPTKKERDISGHLPFSSYIGEQIIQRDIVFYEPKSESVKAMIRESYLDDPINESNGSSLSEEIKRTVLKKGTKIHITKVISVFETTPKSFLSIFSLKSNHILAYGSFIHPVSKQTISAPYELLSKGGSPDGFDFKITTTIRKAPWEPSSVPQQRYVGPLGKDFKQ